MRGKREFLVESRSAGEKRDQNCKRKGTGKHGKLWSQVTHQVVFRSVLQHSIGWFILGRSDFRLMTQEPDNAKPVIQIGTDDR